MDNQRKHDRYFMFDRLTVSIPELGEDIGHLVDLTPAGTMIRSDLPLVADARYRLSVELCEPIDGRETFEVEGTCLWCRPARSLGGFNAGFEFVDVDPAVARILGTLSGQEISALD